MKPKCWFPHIYQLMSLSESYNICCPQLSIHSLSLQQSTPSALRSSSPEPSAVMRDSRSVYVYYIQNGMLMHQCASKFRFPVHQPDNNFPEKPLFCCRWKYLWLEITQFQEQDNIYHDFLSDLWCSVSKNLKSQFRDLFEENITLE